MNTEDQTAFEANDATVDVPAGEVAENQVGIESEAQPSETDADQSQESAPETTESPETEVAPQPKRSKKKRKKRQRPTRIDRLVMDFQPDVVEIERRSVPGGARWTLYVVAALLVGAVAWACWAKVDRIVTAQGKLITTEAPIIVQPVTLSPIRSINVKFGDIVDAGDNLAELDPTFAEAEYESGLLREKSLSAQIARLRTEREGIEYKIDLDSADAEELREFAVYRDRKAEYDAKLTEFESVLKSLSTKVENNKQDQQDIRSELVIYERMRVKSDEAYRKKVISESAYLAENQQRLALERTLNNTRRKLSEISDEIANTKKKIETFKAEWNTKVSAELLKATQDMQQNQQALTKASRMKDLIFLKAPEDLETKKFMVMEVAERSVGSVLREGESLFKLMPLNVDLEAEVEVPARDIARIREEDDARLKLEAFPYQKHGTIDGVVTAISESSFQKGEETQQQTVYRARVKLVNPDALENVPDDVLMPGMIASVEIKVGERRVIEYFLYPLLRTLDKSIREP